VCCACSVWKGQDGQRGRLGRSHTLATLAPLPLPTVNPLITAFQEACTSGAIERGVGGVADPLCLDTTTLGLPTLPPRPSGAGLS
jgi:hypothetical protein